jgi:NAD(P)-dependent dehydrogenase (short-subunit alcohol dehydrogenase family)
MRKTIMITGATDGIGLATAKILAAKGHNLLIHGRSREKLVRVKKLLIGLTPQKEATQFIETYLADLSSLSEVQVLAAHVKAVHKNIDVLINNAGVFKTSEPVTPEGFDVRFMVNTIAPFLLTQLLLQIFKRSSRVVNLSSAAQAPINIDALLGNKYLADMEAYAQSKLGIIIWTKHLSEQYKKVGLVMFAVNPGSLLASKMVKEGFGLAGNDINIGAEILVKMAIEEGIDSYSGQYFDNDKGEFSAPYSDGESAQKEKDTIDAIEFVLRGKY